jgi:hypothetical protein
MARTHTWGTTFKNGSDAITIPQEIVTTDGGSVFDGSLDVDATNVEIDIAFAYANLKSVCIIASRPTTLKTNSSSMPDDTITLAANQVLKWTVNSGTANPFTADVTKVYATKAGAAGTLYIDVLVDVTP